MRRLIWVGDAVCDSGFARCTHEILETLRASFEVTVIGLNHRGGRHKFPYEIIAASTGGDLFGVKLLPDYARDADVVVIQNDPWNIPPYLSELKRQDVTTPVVGFLAVDSKNVRSMKYRLNELAHVIFWTEFARKEAIEGGLSISSGVVPLGVDLQQFSPGDRVVARKALGLPDFTHDKFIVGNINRNQPRKRLDLTIEYFTEWQHRSCADAYLYLHVCPTGDHGIDCNQLAQYYGLGNEQQPRLILAEPEVWKGASLDQVANTYRAFDAQVNTALGEGWGLTTMEGMASAVPQIVGDWSALGEWPEGAIKIPCDPMCFLSRTNQIGGVPRKEPFIHALDSLYKSTTERARVGQAGLRTVQQDKYRWPNIGAAFLSELHQVVGA